MLVMTHVQAMCRWLQAFLELQSKLPSERKLQLWKASLYEQRPYVDDFRSFQNSGGAPEEPLDWRDLSSTSSMSNIDTNPSVTTEERLKSWQKLLEEKDAAFLSPQV